MSPQGCTGIQRLAGGSIPPEPPPTKPLWMESRSVGQPHDIRLESLGTPRGTWVTPHSDGPPPRPQSGLSFLPPVDIDITFSRHPTRITEGSRPSMSLGRRSHPQPCPSTPHHRWLSHSQPLIPTGAEPGSASRRARVRTAIRFQALNQISPRSHLLEHPQEFKTNSRKSRKIFKE